MNDEELKAFLEHHGIKGMHWGIRNEDPLKGRHKGPTLSDFSDHEIRSDQLKRKYAPYTKETGDNFHLTPLEKKIGIGVGIGLGGALLLGGTVYAAKKYGLKINAQEAEALLKNTPVGEAALLNPVAEGEDLLPHQVQIAQLKAAAKADMKILNPGLASHWGTDVNLPTGSIVQRMSTIKETDIRPQGFFAAFEPDDVQRYKAQLPNWWHEWGYKETSGYMVKLRSDIPVKAPNGEQTFNMYKEFISKPEILDKHPAGQAIKKLGITGAERDAVITGLAKQSFPNFALQWANGYDQHPDVQEFFKIAKGHGYNALIDFNDSEHLAKTPLRLLDGTNFHVDGYEKVSEEAIKQAQATVKELVMSLIKEGAAFLSHHGVKGQRWGVRHNPDGVSRKTDRQAAKDAKEFARAKLFFGEGAGNRRKLIKATVESKKKKDPGYAKAFDRHLANQDLGTHAQKARAERSRKDKRKAAKRTGGALARRFTGEMGTNAAFVGVGLTGLAFLTSPKGQRIMSKNWNRANEIIVKRRGNKFVRNLIDNRIR